MQRSKRDAKCKKAINFDLDTKVLEEVYPGKTPTNAYKDIGRFLRKNGFRWRQGSGYVSSNTLTTREVRSIVIALANKFPWLEKCVNVFDVTDIGKEHSMLEIIKSIPQPMLEKTRTNEPFTLAGLDERISSAEKMRDTQQNSEIKSRDDRLPKPSGVNISK